MSKYHFFWNGILSNWKKCEFIVDGVLYCCGEQYMMHAKAKLFCDWEIADKILASGNPREHKALGRKVRNYIDEPWDDVRESIMYKGLRCRAQFDSQFRDELIRYKDCIIVEASPFDRIWGIGYDEHHAMNNQSNWGRNLLGKILTRIAKEVSEFHKSIDE